MSDTAILGGARPAPSLRTAAAAIAPAPAAAAGSRRPILVLLFLISLAIPLFFHVGTLRLAPYRIVLLLLFVPLAIQWLSGRAGRIILPDLLVLAYCVWSSLSLAVIHGLGEIWEFAGMLVVETLGPYWLARVAIRNADAFRFFLASFFVIVAALMIVAAVEGVTGRLVVNQLFEPFGRTFPNAPLEPRWGLERAQATFEHPILFGVFTSAGFGLFLYALGGRRDRPIGVLGAGAAGMATFFSLSMGAYISVMLQGMLIGWDRVTGFLKIPRRWRILFFLTLAAYIVVDIGSNRTPFNVFIDYMTFNTGNAYNRVLIWKYGTAEVWRNPVFGIGLNEWIRAPWMSTSMDNLWLVQAVRYGLPALICFMAAFFTILWRLGKLRIEEPRLADMRAGLLITLGGVMLSICTVHLWNATFCFLMFLLGSGVWLLDHAGDASPPAPAPRASSPARAAPEAGVAPRAPRRSGRAHTIGALDRRRRSSGGSEDRS